MVHHPALRVAQECSECVEGAWSTGDGAGRAIRERVVRHHERVVAHRLRCAGAMSQKSVEIVIGKLATDEALRTRFTRDPTATLRELNEIGLELSNGEITALLEMPVAVLNVLASWVHPRLQKVAFTKDQQEP